MKEYTHCPTCGNNKDKTPIYKCLVCFKQVCASCQKGTRHNCQVNASSKPWANFTSPKRLGTIVNDY